MAPEQKLISFARGAPSLDIIAADDLAHCAEQALRNDPARSFAYGTAVGYQPLREWIAERQSVSVDQVVTTNGSMQADAFLFELMVEPGDLVVVEAPTYDRTLLSLQKLGAEILAIPLQADGIDVEAPTYDRTLLSMQKLGAEILAIPLQADGIDVEALATALEQGARPKLAHIIPNFQNPAGYTLSLDKRRRLLELAEQYDFVIFEDDPYIELRFEGDRLPTMLSMDRAGKVVYASSFSKTVCPGIRVGYLVGPEPVIAAVVKIATETYISPSMVSQSIVTEFCRSGAIERSIETVKNALRERRDALAAALQRELPEARFVAPDGGYFLWVELPEGSDVDLLFENARGRGVVFVKGTDFLIEGGQNTLRIAYSGVTPAEIDEGVSRLAEAYRGLADAAA